MATFSNSIYRGFGKRALDLVASAGGLVFLWPSFVIVALCIKIDSRGPVFYRHVRVGKDGRPFRILKFRSMDAAASMLPAGITVSGDKRVTRFGRVLRRYKVDELPQLWNVLLGHMSLVGPRPELQKYVVSYTPEQRRVLRVRPGITDPATLAYRHEEEILAESEDPDTLYRTRILADKLDRNLAYIRDISFGTDLIIIFETIYRSFLSAWATPGYENPSGKQHRRTSRDFVKPSSGSSN